MWITCCSFLSTKQEPPDTVCGQQPEITLGQHDLLQQKSEGVLLVQDYQQLQWIPAQAHAGYLLHAGIPKENNKKNNKLGIAKL